MVEITIDVWDGVDYEPCLVEDRFIMEHYICYNSEVAEEEEILANILEDIEEKDRTHIKLNNYDKQEKVIENEDGIVYCKKRLAGPFRKLYIFSVPKH